MIKYCVYSKKKNRRAHHGGEIATTGVHDMVGNGDVEEGAPTDWPFNARMRAASIADHASSESMMAANFRERRVRADPVLQGCPQASGLLQGFHIRIQQQVAALSGVNREVVELLSIAQVRGQDVLPAPLPGALGLRRVRPQLLLLNLPHWLSSLGEKDPSPEGLPSPSGREVNPYEAWGRRDAKGLAYGRDEIERRHGLLDEMAATGSVWEPDKQGDMERRLVQAKAVVPKITVLPEGLAVVAGDYH